MSKTITALVAAVAVSVSAGWFGNSVKAPSLDIVCRNAVTGNVVYRIDIHSVRMQVLSSYIAREGMADLNNEIISISFKYDGRNVRLVASSEPGNNSLSCTYEQASETPKN